MDYTKNVMLKAKLDLFYFHIYLEPANNDAVKGNILYVKTILL